jgi:2',3'-cyclic-nucleotide 2'-phosphodiesterase (5'-nucleotidase family)
VVVALTHLGLPQDVRLAAAVEGIDLILGGHDHKALQHGFRAKSAGGREVLICQAGDQYRYLGQVEMTLSPRLAAEGFQVARITAKLIPLDETVPPDPATEALLSEWARGATRPPPPPLDLRRVGPPATRPAMIAAPSSAPATAPAETSPALVPAGR